MAEAPQPFSSAMGGDSAESSTAAAAMYSRNDDAMTRRLRAEGNVDIEELVDLNRQHSPPPVDASSVGTLTATTLFSSHKPSTVTKQTSAGTSYPVPGHAGKGKAVATYASSLSATHGSGSDTEIEAIRDETLFGVGDWAGGPAESRTLKGSARARRRSRPVKRLKHKKPPVVIIQQHGTESASDEDDAPMAKQVTRRNGREAQYLRQRRSKPALDQLKLAEEGRASEAPSTTKPPQPPRLTRTRYLMLIGLVVAIALTFSLSTFAAHYTGKGRLGCTKGIIFAATLLISCFTLLAMLIARRALQEALLAGVLEFLVGFALVIEIHDFL